MSKDRIELNEKQIKAIENYLQMRLGCYGIASYKLQIKETTRMTYAYSISQEIPKNALGIFSHALDKCSFFGEIWSLKKQTHEHGHRHMLQCGLRYEHFGGGSNGCDMNIKCYVYSDGEIREAYDK